MSNSGLMVDIRNNQQSNQNDMSNNNAISANTINSSNTNMDTSSENLQNLSSPIEYKPDESLLMNGDGSYNGNGNFLLFC